MSRLVIAKPAAFSLLILFLGFQTQSGFAQVTSDESKPTDEDLQVREMVRTIKATCRSERALHGAWLFFNEITEDEVTYVVDRSRAAAQSKRLDELFAVLPANLRPKRIAVIELPLSELLAQLRPRIEAALGKRGRFIQGAYYSLADPNNEPEGDVLISLFGRVPNRKPEGVEQDNVIIECQKLMDKDPVWKQLPDERRIAPDARAMKDRAASQRLIKAENQILPALRIVPELQGVWVDLAECFDLDESFVYYDVITWLDADNLEAQRSDIKVLLDEVLGTDYKLIEEIPLPLTKTLADAKFIIDANSVLDGCLLEGAYFERREPITAPKAGEDSASQAGGTSSVELVPFGRIASEDQRARIQNVFEVFLKRSDRPWRSDVGVVPTARTDGPLVIVSPSIHRGGMFFADALEHYWDCRFDKAEKAFQRAIAERPFSLDLRYWRSLALLSLGREHDAYRQMLAVAHRRPSARSLRSVDRSLTRVQGPIRVELRRLETRANGEFYIGQSQRLQEIAAQQLAQRRREAAGRSEAAVLTSLQR